MIANALPRPLTAGSVDNAILRADGTGGSTLQSSGLLVEDAIVSFTGITGDAATDIITATGHNLVADQPVRFTALTGGSGLLTTTNYFVRDISGSTFKVSTTSGGAAVNFTTNITAGTLLTGHSVSTNVTLSENTTATNSDLVLTPKGTGALIAGPKPDGTATGGNARGTRAVDLQLNKNNAAQVASGNNSFIGGGSNNTAASTNNVCVGGSSNTCGGQGGSGNFIGGGTSNNIPTANYCDNSAIVGGSSNRIIASDDFIGGGRHNDITGSNSVICGGGRYESGLGFGVGNTITGNLAGILGGWGARGDRLGMQAHASGQFSTAFNVSGVGDAQRARFVLRNKTTTNSAVELFLDGSSTRLTIPSGKIIALTINIAGVSSTGGAVAHYMRQYCLKNVAATTSEVYAPITIGTDNAAGTLLSLTFNDPADALVVSVTGTASTIWRWVASVDAVEIAYGT